MITYVTMFDKDAHDTSTMCGENTKAACELLLETLAHEELTAWAVQFPAPTKH